MCETPFPCSEAKDKNRRARERKELTPTPTYRIMESLKLGKPSKVIKSNHQPNTTMPAKPCPKEPHLHVS